MTQPSRAGARPSVRPRPAADRCDRPRRDGTEAIWRDGPRYLADGRTDGHLQEERSRHSFVQRLTTASKSVDAVLSQATTEQPGIIGPTGGTCWPDPDLVRCPDRRSRTCSRVTMQPIVCERHHSPDNRIDDDDGGDGGDDGVDGWRKRNEDSARCNRIQ